MALFKLISSKEAIAVLVSDLFLEISDSKSSNIFSFSFSGDDILFSNLIIVSLFSNIDLNEFELELSQKLIILEFS